MKNRFIFTRLQNTTKEQASPKSIWTVLDPKVLFASYNSILQGVGHDYLPAISFTTELRWIQHLLLVSLLQTLSQKYQFGSVAKAYRQCGYPPTMTYLTIENKFRSAVCVTKKFIKGTTMVKTHKRPTLPIFSNILTHSISRSKEKEHLSFVIKQQKNQDKIETKMEKEIKQKQDKQAKTEEVTSFDIKKPLKYDMVESVEVSDEAVAEPSIWKITVDQVSKLTTSNENTAEILTRLLLHKSGTTTRANRRQSVSIKIEGQTYTLNNGGLWKALEYANAVVGNSKVTPRQLARLMENEILDTAIHFQIPGNLAKTFINARPNLSREELCFAADYVNAANPRVPEKIRILLTAHKQTSISTSKQSFLDSIQETYSETFKQQGNGSSE
eukprot:TRINITY_DN9999_c0_g1_i1.p1 TRINITY_DN9999_c0_g1~~TRINITY_DN9999_c0_g1_i1.p1  ORF type:complete len:386 (-),score=-3.85 TRINITY_DN9999_c0_g1_i1:256-1413(-)